ncbi:MAG: ASPIC/UnbV domain-containing protein, partial [Planctomycetota bacterium]|jgi:hypothetical protein
LSNRDGIGAQVNLYSEKGLQYRQHNGGMEGYVQHSKSIHFGLGNTTRIDKIGITWPNGGVSAVRNINPNQTVIIRENS